MIYLIPTKQLQSEKNRDHAKQFAKKFESLSDVHRWADGLVSNLSCIKTASETLKVNAEYSVPFSDGKQKAWAEATLINDAFPVKLHSSSVNIRAGIDCPYLVEKSFKQSDTSKKVSTRLREAVDYYNDMSDGYFELQPSNFKSLVMTGFMEKPILNNSSLALQEQKQRMMSQFQKHILSKVVDLVCQYNPSLQQVIKKEKNSEFSLDII